MLASFDFADFTLAAPEILLLAASLAILLIDAFSTHPKRSTTLALALATLGALTLVSLNQWQNDVSGRAFHGLYVADPLAHLLKIASYIAVAVTLVYGHGYARARGMLKGGELYVLALLALLGQMVMISAANLITVYLGLELMSLALYALIALRRDHAVAVEAAMKYFVLGALASGFLLYGMSMLYGATGQLGLAEIARAVQAAVAGQHGAAAPLALVFGVVFIVAGLAFKLGVVPFHMWVPDVYQGAPTAVTLILGAAPKIAALAMTLRLLVEALHALAFDWQPMLLILAVLSLAIGNFTALVQTNFKRMLAYSTISHMGFVVLGLLAGVASAGVASAGVASAGVASIEAGGQTHPGAYGASLFYMLTYVLTTLGSFGLVLLLSRAGFECEQIDDLKGLNRRSPLAAALLLILMFSLAGIPPLVGFYAKLAILQALLNLGHVAVAIAAVMFSLIGAFYYLRVVKVAYFDHPVEADPAADPSAAATPASAAAVFASATPAQRSLLAANAAALLALGFLPGGLMALCTQTIARSLGF